MRVNKYRVWDKDLRRFRKPEECNQLVIRPLTGRVSEGAIVPNVVLLQYTGLEDKHGCEIYEGDIVRVIEDSCMGGVYLGEIEHLSNWGVYGFNMFDAKVVEVRDFGKNTSGFLMKLFGNCFTLAEAFKHGDESKFEVEIIGNIYENPELLSKEEIEDE